MVNVREPSSEVSALAPSPLLLPLLSPHAQTFVFLERRKTPLVLSKSGALAAKHWPKEAKKQRSQEHPRDHPLTPEPPPRIRQAFARGKVCPTEVPCDAVARAVRP